MIAFIVVFALTIVLTVYCLWGFALAFGCVVLYCLDELSWKGWALILSSIFIWTILWQVGFTTVHNMWMAL